jgi:predicted ATPase
MTMASNLTVSVENFGPVRAGQVTLKPFTIFIGPNNSGKSYIATLVYALTKALAERSPSPLLWGLNWPLKPGALPELSADEQQQLLKWYAEQSAGKNHPEIALGTLPDGLKTVIGDAVRHHAREMRKSIDEALRDYFGAEDTKSLIRGGDDDLLVIALNRTPTADPLLRYSVDSNKKMSRLRWTLPDIENLRIRVGRGEFPFVLPGAGSKSTGIAMRLLSMIVADTWSQILAENGVLLSDSYYLPAARSGILQGWQVFASMALQMVRRRVGLERIEVPPVTGIAGDFLQVLWERLLSGSRRQNPPELKPALEVLESRVFHGDVSLDRRSAESPLIVYKSGSLRLPLQRVSSMIGELAPLELWIKHLVRPGELLIIDEPEAHLHPEGQRWIARVLVRLVNAGVRVLCTTHSSLILHQVSNHLLASSTDAATRSANEFEEADILDDVAVYLFDRREDGTHVNPVPMEAGFGIPEEEFLRVAESIGDETYRLTSQPEPVV